MKYLVFVLLISLSSTSYAQQELKDKIAKVYEDFSLLYNDVAIVKKSGKWGLITKKGKPLTGFDFDRITRVALENQDFDVYRVERKGKVGILSEEGSVLVHVDYYFVHPQELGSKLFYEIYSNEEGGRALYDRPNDHYYGRVGFLNSQGDVISPIQYDTHFFNDFDDFMNSHENYLIRVEKDGQKGFINLEGEEIIPIAYDRTLVESSEKFGALVFLTLKNRQMLVNVTGDTLVPPDFHEVHLPYNVGGELVSKVIIKNDTSDSVLTGLYKLGKGLVKPLCNCRYRLNNDDDNYIEYQDGQYNLLSLSGKYLNEYPLDQISQLKENGYYVFTKDDKKGILRGDGQIIVNPEYQSIWYNVDHFEMRQDEKTVFYHTEKNCSHVFSKSQDVYYPGNHLFFYTKNDSAFIYLFNSDLHQPVSYEVIGKFQDQRAAIAYVDENGFRKDEKTGFIDTTGAIVIQPDQFKTRSFSSGRIALEKEGRFQYVDVMGNPINDEWYDVAEPFKGNMAIAQKDGYYGVISTDGKVLIPFTFSSIFHVDNSYGKEDLINRKYGIRNEEIGYEVWLRIFDGDLEATITSYDTNEEYDLYDKELSRILGIKKSDLDELY